ncbi:MAG TPA: 1-acyl-sn-glycerol-3-phosphate acyltransferase [Candidatus Krumholzibacteria bacterium]|jgi:1-acyl-sn-glycerol-3-phosphate acyltransferase
MSPLRALFRLPPFFLLTCSIAVLHQLHRLLCFGSARRSMAARTFWMRAWGRGCLWILGGRLEVEGVAPEPPYLLVTNHLSYVDILLLAAALPAVHFVSRADVRQWPILGPVATAGQTIYVERERSRDLPQVVDRMRAILAEGGGIAFFPEATTSGGTGLLPFRGPLFEAPVCTGFAVLCASICYETSKGVPAAAESICWWRDMPFVSHVWGLLGLRGFRARLCISPRAQRGADRKELAALCQQEVQRIFRPTTQAESSMGELTEFVGLNRSLLQGLASVLRSLSVDAYATRRPQVKSEGVGAHVRHVLDFYGCLFDQMSEGSIDYDRRPREPELESDPSLALARIDRFLARLSELQADAALVVAHDSPRGTGTSGASSIQRELCFIASHAVHHFAIVAMLLRLEGHEVDAEFGVAPSTLEHLRRVGLGSA